MKSFMDEKLTSRWFWAKSQQKHSDRLREIKKKLSTRINNSPPTISRMSNSGTKFLEKEQKTQIQTKNERILNVLVDISRGRRSTSTGLILDSAQNIPRKKSLNIISRKQQIEKINLDNEALARRLNKNSTLSFKKLEKQWKISMKYKKTISKSKFRSLPHSEKSRKSTGNASSIHHRTQSLGSDPLFLLSNDKTSPINTQRSEIVFIDSHKPSENLSIQGVPKTRYLKSCEPIQINPPKSFIKLDPLLHKPK